MTLKITRVGSVRITGKHDGFPQWNRIFTDSRLTAALVDRLIHHAHIISFHGESYRLSHALSKRN
ncbi:MULTISPECIES: ATP-binding protein [Ureibacillus]|uniref:ATP-binding protein n=1 Tax=Ureibacillus TaxID=160795 RepID=UPI0038B57543